MKLYIHYCDGTDYSKEGFKAEIKNRLLYHINGEKIPITCSFDPEVIGYSDGKFNVVFLDSDKKITDDQSQFFAKINRLQRAKLKWAYGKHLFQDRWFIGLVLSFISGWYAQIGFQILMRVIKAH